MPTRWEPIGDSPVPVCEEGAGSDGAGVRPRRSPVPAGQARYRWMGPPPGALPEGRRAAGGYDLDRSTRTHRLASRGAEIENGAMRPRTAVLIAALVLLALLLLAPRLASPILSPALGFAAKVTCSGVLVGGETPAQVRVGFPDPNLRRIVRVSVDGERGLVEATIPLLGRRTAVYREGLGCTLEPARGEIAPFASRGAAPALGAGVGGPWPDGDELALPADGIDMRRLDAAVDSAFQEPPWGARRTRAVVVVHGGHLILERYAEGFGPENRYGGWSMTKSVTSALVGILVGDGLVDLTDSGLRPEWSGPGDPRREIHLGHLMHMSSGLGFDESYTPRGAATAMLFDSPDAAAYAARSPLEATPGTRWEYSSATTNLVSAHLRERIGDDSAYLALPRERLFDPIGMRSAVMEPDAAGTLVGSSFMYATARDWARFGLLFLRDGVWNGRRILPEGWVEYSVTPAPAADLGRYGAHWWLNAGEPGSPERRPRPDLPADLYWASGFQGQYVAVIPSRDLVVVRLGLNEFDEVFVLGDFLRSILQAVPERSD
jgi:CubicO group peptidase (beta-lactamase class C family)